MARHREHSDLTAAAVLLKMVVMPYLKRSAVAERLSAVVPDGAADYPARRYGLTQIGISGRCPERRTLPDAATSIAGDLGLRTDLLDPVEGITPNSRGTDYLSVQCGRA